ncbi:hypothetical protein GGTG_02827 [Gaeumannomyces tritici R3-111a-1]|uniref:Uncharacterized protein n=1 Tax=Gaeumannomyces tritici (strain R3-111a-1) TaxID=644352 RepID=J3NNH1_GAET3|nr:hypothetical protein GGTG_02827 [Gaeumannomyces tritici R3-111a-1]EJT77722.1 hypothetical protein GGTG_02827 [Gaeumannomyces tritici R3-111a-1]
MATEVLPPCPHPQSSPQLRDRSGRLLHKFHMPPTAGTPASSDDESEASFHTSRKTVSAGIGAAGAAAAAVAVAVAAAVAPTTTTPPPHRDLDDLYREFLTARADDFAGLHEYTNRLMAVRDELALAGEHIPDRLVFSRVELGARSAAQHELTVNLALAICNKRATRSPAELVRQLLAVDGLLEAEEGAPAPAPAPAPATAKTTATTTETTTTTTTAGGGSQDGGGGGGRVAAIVSSSSSGGGPVERKNFHPTCGKYHTGGDEKCYVVLGSGSKEPNPNYHARCGNVHAGGDDRCWEVHPELRPPKRAAKPKAVAVDHDRRARYADADNDDYYDRRPRHAGPDDYDDRRPRPPGPNGYDDRRATRPAGGNDYDERKATPRPLQFARRGGNPGKPPRGSPTSWWSTTGYSE